MASSVVEWVKNTTIFWICSHFEVPISPNSKIQEVSCLARKDPGFPIDFEAFRLAISSYIQLYPYISWKPTGLKKIGQLKPPFSLKWVWAMAQNDCSPNFWIGFIVGDVSIWSKNWMFFLDVLDHDYYDIPLIMGFLWDFYGIFYGLLLWYISSYYGLNMD